MIGLGAHQLRSPTAGAKRGSRVGVQDAFEAAHRLDSAGDAGQAKRHYATSIAAAEDGMALQIATSGLGSRFSTVDKAKADLSKWRDLAGER